MFLHEKTSKTASPRSIGAEDAMKKEKKPSTKLAQTKKPAKPGNTVREDTGKLLLDIGKLVLASIVLGTILRYDFSREQLLTVGIAVAIVLFVGGIILGAKKKRSEENDNQTEKKE
jgi:undecaprenyl pyrophosphate phosphatase UppP